MIASPGSIKLERERQRKASAAAAKHVSEKFPDLPENSLGWSRAYYKRYMRLIGGHRRPFTTQVRPRKRKVTLADIIAEVKRFFT